MASRFYPMNRGLIVAVVILVSAILGNLQAQAASGAPQIMNYQGYLADDGGNPITGSKTMSFRIYATIDAAQSAALWQSGNVTVQVTNGQFSVNLGESPQTALPATLFTDDSRFLGITVDGTELTERKRLVSVPYALNGGIPSGGIIMWKGSVAEIPAGWALCDGQNGTPDLRDRFVLGAGGTYAVGANGGSSTINLAHSHTVSSHNHSIGAESPGTSQVGDHAHSGTTSGPNDTHGVADGNDDRPAAEKHTHTFTTSGAGAHSHTVNSHSHGGATGGSSPTTDSRLSNGQSILPPYYALCFIMKL